MNPPRSGISLVWRHPCPPNIIKTLISDRNPEGILTNYDLELSALVLPEATLLEMCPEATMAAPLSGLDNTPTVSWSTWEASTINPVVAFLLRICALHSRYFFIIPLVFYHPGLENCTVDDTSCLFDIYDTPFIAHMSATYPSLQIS